MSVGLSRPQKYWNTAVLWSAAGLGLLLAAALAANLLSPPCEDCTSPEGALKLARACFAGTCEAQLPLVSKACAQACVAQTNVQVTRGARLPISVLDEDVGRHNEERRRLVRGGPVPELDVGSCNPAVARARCEAQGRPLCEEETLQFVQSCREQLADGAVGKARAREELRQRLLPLVGPDGKLFGDKEQP